MNLTVSSPPICEFCSASDVEDAEALPQEMIAHLLRWLWLNAKCCPGNGEAEDASKPDRHSPNELGHLRAYIAMDKVLEQRTDSAAS